jgi:hypothetical protein
LCCTIRPTQIQWFHCHPYRDTPSRHHSYLLPVAQTCRDGVYRNSFDPYGSATMGKTHESCIKQATFSPVSPHEGKKHHLHIRVCIGSDKLF